MEVLTGEEMRRVDRRAIEELGIASLLLMESAGRGVAEALLEDYPDAAARGVVVLCGKGNNGGDGLAAARHLARLGVPPRVLLLAEARALQGDAQIQWRAARGSGLLVEEIPDAAAWAAVRAVLERRVIVVDALLGTGARGGARGFVGEVVQDINRSAADVVAVDLPSGLDADTAAVTGPAVGADRTYTLCRPKLPLVAEPAALHAGMWRVIPIGIPDDVVRAERPRYEWLDAQAVRALLGRRESHSHKGTFGHLLVVAGSRGKSGAAALVARAALRSGVGLVTVATAASAQPTVASHWAEVMTEPLPETREGSISEPALGRVLELLARRQALALGPGLGTARPTATLVHELLDRRGAPAVADADALNVYAEIPERLRAGAWPLVLTPHPGEAARLLGTSTSDVQSDRLVAARALAERTGAVVVLKGHRTLVAAPDGRVAFNSTGNPGMATAGTGDVLTGIVGAYLARGLEALDAARLAVYVHGRAGDLVAQTLGEESLVAGDLIQALPQVLAELAAAAEPHAW